jgi:hypothetical protein
VAVPFRLPHGVSVQYHDGIALEVVDAGAKNMRGSDEPHGGDPRQTLIENDHPDAMIRPAMLLTLLALTIALAAALPARAQGPLGLFPEPPDEVVREALDSAYARALLATFAASVRRHGDPSCLQAKALDDEALVAGGRALWQRHGVRMLQLLDENFDHAAYQAALSARLGPDAVAEMERLERDPDVKTLKALERPAGLASLLDIIIEQFDRYVLIGRIKLDPISPIARGETEPMKDNPTQAAEAAVQRFLDEHPSPRIERYLELLGAVEAARSMGVTKQAALKLGPMAYFAGAERDLAELCVGRR